MGAIYLSRLLRMPTASTSPRMSTWKIEGWPTDRCSHRATRRSVARFPPPDQRPLEPGRGDAQPRPRQPRPRRHRIAWQRQQRHTAHQCGSNDRGEGQSRLARGTRQRIALAMQPVFGRRMPIDRAVVYARVDLNAWRRFRRERPPTGRLTGGSPSPLRAMCATGVCTGAAPKAGAVISSAACPPAHQPSAR